ncbi:MAG: Ig-like domain-containing protein [bacterium]
MCNHKLLFTFRIGAWFFFTGVSFWVCSKNPPLDPTQVPSDNIVIIAGIQSQPDEVSPGGSALIQAVLLDQSAKPAPGHVVLFSTNFGSISSSTDTTNESGIASTTFTAPLQTGHATITASLGTSQSQTVTVAVINNTPESVSMIPDASEVLANGMSSTVIRTIWTSENGQPLKGVPVTFTSTAGTITTSATTDSFGVASAELISLASETDVVAQVAAQAAQLEASTQVLFKGIRFELNAAPTNLIADGTSTSSVTAVLKEATSNVAISGAAITFAADLGTIPNSGLTNSSGVTTVNLTSVVQTGVATVTAFYGKTLTRSLQVVFAQSTPTYLNVSAEPPVIFADNQSRSIIKATVSDQGNNPVPDGTEVSFAIVAGSGSIESNKVTAGGVASSTLTSSMQPDTVVIVASVAQLSDTTTVRYIIGEAATLTVTADSTSLPADGMTSTRVVARVFDAAGHSVVDGTRVSFVTDLGEITPTAQTQNGQALAQFTSSVTGIATIQASVGSVRDVVTIHLRPGPPNSILLSFDPNTLGVKDSGRNQSINIIANVVDSKNNPVPDGSFVRFSIFSSPGGGELLSSADAIPTLNGQSQVSLNSGIRSGSVRILAQVTDSQGTPITPEVRAVSTEIIIFAGPPFIEDVNVRATSHVSVGVSPLNAFGWNVVNNIVSVTAVVGDKFNNPVPPGTAVFFTTTGGVISTHTGFTNEEGVANVTLHTAQPYPDVTRYYNTFFDPNTEHPGFTLGTNIIPGPISDFDGGEVLNSLGDFIENDGIARILAVTEGVDSEGNSARVWSVTNVVFSGHIDVFDISVSDTVISPGESTVISFRIYDENGNPIVPGSEISISANGGTLSWSSLTTSDPGITHYNVLLTNNLDPTDPDARPVTTPVTIVVNSQNGNLIRTSEPIDLILN